jgi:predicted phosphoribosyltransferase
MSLTPLRKAGRVLAARLEALAPSLPIIVAIPRRGMVVGQELSRILGAPFDIVMVSKVYADRSDATPIGAVAVEDVRVADASAAAIHGVSPLDLARALDTAATRLAQRRLAIRGDLPALDLGDRVVVIVDDAVISGVTMEVAARAIALDHPARIIAATPLCADEARPHLAPHVAELVAVEHLPALEAAARHEAASRDICPPLSDDELHATMCDARGSVRRPRPLR